MEKNGCPYINNGIVDSSNKAYPINKGIRKAPFFVRKKLTSEEEVDSVL
jgi:hypothetical protein